MGKKSLRLVWPPSLVGIGFDDELALGDEGVIVKRFALDDLVQHCLVHRLSEVTLWNFLRKTGPPFDEIFRLQRVELGV